MPLPLRRVAVTGAAGQIAYNLLFRIAQGELFGRDQPVLLSLLDIPDAATALEGVRMELEDSACPLLAGIELHHDPYLAFEEVDIALLIGAKPRGPGMERKDLLRDNGKIFVEQGDALEAVASPLAKVFVVGNPCNTNCLIALHRAPRLRRDHFFAMTRLDQNRAVGLLAQQADVPINSVSHVTIWGNHSATQVPDVVNAQIVGRSPHEMISDQDWLANEFPSLVQQRGAEVIKKRGKSSSGSAAAALIHAVKDVLQPTQENDWFSMGVYSEGNPYRIDQDLVFSFPCRTNQDRHVKIVAGLEWTPELETKIRRSEKELQEERDMIKDWL